MPHVLLICEPNDIVPVMAAFNEWEDIFDITVLPAVAAEEGLKLAEQMMHEAQGWRDSLLSFRESLIPGTRFPRIPLLGSW